MHTNHSSLALPTATHRRSPPLAPPAAAAAAWPELPLQAGCPLLDIAARMAPDGPGC